MKNTKRKFATAALTGVAVLAVAGAASADEGQWVQPWDVQPTTPTPSTPEPAPTPEPTPAPAPTPEVTPSKPAPAEKAPSTNTDNSFTQPWDTAPVDKAPSTTTDNSFTQPWDTKPTPSETTPEAETTSNEAVDTDLNELPVTEVSVAKNAAGNFVFTAPELSNYNSSTVTVDFGKVPAGKVLKLKNGKDLSTVAYHATGDKIKIILHKEGELVLVDQTVKVTDIAKSQFKGDIQNLIDRGIFTGYKGKFNPQANMTISQFSITISRALGLNPTGTDTKYFSSHNGALEEYGIMDATPYINQAITREEAFTALGKLLAKHGVTTNVKAEDKFKDISKMDQEAKDAAALLFEIGAVHGYQNKLNPNDTITRGQLAKVLNKVFTHLELI